MTEAEWARMLNAGIGELELTLAPASVSRFCSYLRLLQEWNQRYNLTAVRDPGDMVRRHLLDSLAVVRLLHGDSVLDVGTGAGLPGIPLAVACPGKHFVLLDSNGKKIRFVTHAVAALGLTNVQVVQVRAEDYRPAEQFATVISRAFAQLADFLSLTAHLCVPGGRWLAMKGAPSEEELQKLPAGFRVIAVHPLKVPGLDARRCVVEVERTNSHLPLSAGGRGKGEGG